jgi:hypothetical protein
VEWEEFYLQLTSHVARAHSPANTIQVHLTTRTLAMLSTTLARGGYAITTGFSCNLQQNTKFSFQAAPGGAISRSYF